MNCYSSDNAPLLMFFTETSLVNDTYMCLYVYVYTELTPI